ncbi:MAG TPA: L-lactate dehydrogenase [Xanthomonadaceae bacterium]|nr:L-lactate dehydrogenase [Xanthomonadaceae bacterium]
MIRPCPVTADDYRALARGRLPRFLFDYVDGGAGEERTMVSNATDWAAMTLRQRVLVDVDGVDTSATLAGEACRMPLALAPVGLAGIMARRGEAQAARAAQAASVPFTLSTVGICPLDEVAAASGGPFWFQLYMLRDRGIVEALLARAWETGSRTLVFTVDLPLAGMRHRDPRNGMSLSGFRPKLLKLEHLLTRPGWIWNVALRGKPLVFGNLAEHVPAARDLNGMRAFIEAQFDPTVTWTDIAWLRSLWQGRLLLKGILDEDDARQAVQAGADGIVVSNHGGRQLDGAASTAASLPAIARAVGTEIEVLVDGGVRSGVDVFRAVARGARGVMIGRPWVWALAGGGEANLRALLATWQQELHTTMALCGVTRVADIDASHLDEAHRSG